MSEDWRCRSCADGVRVFLSLGKMPLPDALLGEEQLHGDEPRFPLDVAFCPTCSLVQLVGDVPAEMMFVDNYLYFSSFSESLVEHARHHALNLIDRRGLGPENLVVEVASNDGYLLRHVMEAGVPALGIDPSPGPAAAARKLGIPTREEFFGLDLAKELTTEGARADVIIANNVMAHVPDLNDFVAGMAHLLADDGVITVENPEVGALISLGQFDTIYHEHVCYYSSTAVANLADRHGLVLTDIEPFPDLHGGTLRWHLSKHGKPSEAVTRHLERESETGLTEFSYYADFGTRVETIRRELLTLLTDLKERGHSIAAYGAAAKGTTLLNYVGIDADLVDFVVDRNTHKHGLYMPGVHLPILPTEALLEHQPDYTLLLTWNFAEEIVRQQHEYRMRGGRFIRPSPTPEMMP